MKQVDPALRLSRALAAVGLAAMAAVLSMRRLGDFDLPWHLANGRQIVRHGAIPAIDDLAYTARPIEYTEALSDLGLYGLMQLGGPLALQVTAALVVVAVGCAIWGRARRAGPAAWLVVTLALAAMNAWLLVRPATVGFLLLAVQLLLIETHRKAPDSARGRRALVALVPLMLIWANAHASVFLGAVILVLYVGARWAARLGSERAPSLLPRADRLDAPAVTLVAAAALLAATLNPMGVGLLVGPLRAQRDFGTVTEWVRPDLDFLFAVEPATGLLLAVTVLALLVGREREGRVPNLFDAALVLLALALGATAVRLIPFAAVLVAPIVARRLAPLVPKTRAMAACAGVSVLLLAPLFWLKSYVSLGVGFEPTHFPDGAVAWIERERPHGRMWNFMPFGGYLSYRLYPEYRVLIDGRSGFVHDSALAKRAHDSNFDPEAFDGLVEEFGIEWAVTRSREGERFGYPLASRRSWVMTHFDDVGAVYVRRDGPNRALAARGYRAFHHLMPFDRILQDAAQGGHPEIWSHDGALAVKQAPNSPRARLLDACGALATRDRPRFDRALSALAALAPGHPSLPVLEQAWRIRAPGG